MSGSMPSVSLGDLEMCNGQLFSELIFRLGGIMLFSSLGKVKLKAWVGRHVAA
jgi:hypothetical protein